MSNYMLLTGATGLLGRYLLRDLTEAGVKLAVVVRRSRRVDAEDRVHGLMGTWESILGRELSQPKVLEGDLTQPRLGLSDEDYEWVSENCCSMLHNAASLQFIATSPEGEPWRSNVTGTQHVLDLCRETGIREFHHVSTSYVCGRRTGSVLESELDVGQELGNDYEKSKVQAEKMVRGSDFLDSLTVYRPAIIVGDSQNGFTTTFHGFYATLNLAYTLTKSLDAEMGRPDDVKTRVTLDGTECKNLVPVDWVSAAMTRVLTRPEFHGQTYHLTPTQPTGVSVIRDVLEEAYDFKGAEFSGSDAELENPTEIEQLFYEHLKVYESYWRDDPTFDSSNTKAAAPDLPCPVVDRELLLMMARKAIEMDFRFKDAPPVVA